MRVWVRYPPSGTTRLHIHCFGMQNHGQPDPVLTKQLHELLALEVADIVAAANEQGFATRDILRALISVVEGSLEGLEVDPDPAEDPAVSN